MDLTDEPRPMGTATLSLVDLRRQLIRKASALSVRAKALHARGDHTQAARVENEAARIREAARSIRTSRDAPGPPS